MIDARSSTAAPLAEQAGVQIAIDRCRTEPVVAEIDARRVERILRNLLGNAIEHGEGEPVEVALAADEDALAITVPDHGVGPQAGRGGAGLQPVLAGRPVPARQTGGTGLGLAISLEDARLHGGWLQAWGAPGEGARFRLTLPLDGGTHHPFAVGPSGRRRRRRGARRRRTLIHSTRGIGPTTGSPARYRPVP